MASSLASPTLKTCLVATDFSETANLAVAWATHIAETHCAKLIITHALSSPIPPEVGIDFIVPAVDLYKEHKEHSVTQLAKAVEQARSQGADASSELLQGYASKQILELAEEKNADLIVIGTRGLTGWQHLVVGSVAAQVLRESKSPVLAIHPDSAAPDKPVRRILVPTDFSEDADLAIHAAYQLLSKEDEGAELIFLHTYDLPVEYAGFAGVSMISEREILAKVDEKLAEVAEKFRQNGITVETRVRRGYAPIAILDFAKECEADLIAMGTHGRSAIRRFFIGSTAERVLQRAHCPVLTVHR